MIPRTTLIGGGLGLAAVLVGTTAASAEDFPVCGAPETDSCLVVQATPGCADASCCKTVCLGDLFCCEVEWDGDCVDLAVTLCGGGTGCGDPNSGACDVANGTPGCDDLDCCSTVCNEDPFCCDTAWDSLCASAAAVLCFGGDPPENDVCANAIDLGSGDSVTPFSSLGALTDGIELPPECESFGEVIIRADIWFTWTATTSEIVVISTCNDANFDSRLALWEGDCENLTLVACNDDGLGCADFTSELVSPVVAGTTYTIQLGGYLPPAQGDGNLTICEGEACLAGCIAECSKGDVTEAEGCGGDTNGGCNDPSGTPSSEPISIGDSVCGSTYASGGTRDTDWFDFTLDQTSIVTMTVEANASMVGLFVSRECPEPSLVIGGEADCGGEITACLPAGDYYAFIGPNGFDGIPCGSGPLNLYRFTLAAEPAAEVAGDLCSTAIDLGTFEGDVEVDTACTGTDGDDLPLECDSFGSITIFNDLFYRWTVPSDGDWSVSTCNQATFDTRLAAYSSCGGTFVACNDDGAGCAGFSSVMDLPGLVAGEELIIQIGSFDGAQGTATMTISQGGGGPSAPQNDNCADAIEVVDGAVVVSTLASTTDGGPLPIECDSFGSVDIFNDVWYRYTATCEGTVTMSFCVANDSTFDTRMAVYGDGCEGPVVACNDDVCGLYSEVTFATECDKVYLVRVGSYSETGFGTATLDISCVGSVCGDGGGCSADFNADGVVDGADYGFILAAWGPCSDCPEDLNNDGTVDGADVGDLLVQWGVCVP
ncbi:MAG: hypothetical protein VX672_10685 [Planctomycetota bacterium]|nr:hypothetical protein [Planctomycetota bacterium]